MESGARRISFAERIKSEHVGSDPLPKEWVDEQKKLELGYAVQIVKRLGRPISAKESLMMF